MTDIGMVLVSHSKDIVQGLVDLILEVAPDVSLTYVGGTEDGGIGSSFDRVEAAVAANPAQQIFAFFDLGSAKMNLEMVADFTEKDIQIQSVPLIEGAYTAAALLQAGAEVEEVLVQLQELEIKK